MLPPRAAFIGGRWLDDGEPFGCENPATTDVLCDLPSTRPSGVDRAVAVARAALEGDWGSWSPRRRQRVLARLAQLDLS